MKDCIVIYVCWKSNEKRSHNNVKTKQKFVSRYESFLTRCRFFVVVREIKFSVCLCFPDLFQVWMVVWCLTVIWRYFHFRRSKECRGSTFKIHSVSLITTSICFLFESDDGNTQEKRNPKFKVGWLVCIQLSIQMRMQIQIKINVDWKKISSNSVLFLPDWINHNNSASELHTMQ